MTIQIKTNYISGEAELRWGKYANGANALQLFSPKGEPLMTASVCMADYDIDRDEIFIKDWSENEGILGALIDAGILQDLNERAPTGFVEAALCRILVEM